ncbi:MAG: flagellar protein FliS [Lachnospiraceae bacterium]|nr:flagellar protein FliS [Lachnospiraceae bacterium]
MTKELIQDYTLRITQANASEIVVIVYDIAEQYIKDALKSYDEGDYEAYRANCQSACRCVEDLLQALDYSYELAFPLMRLYVFINREISLASVKNKTEGLLNARGLLISLRDAFAQVAKQDKSPSVMGNTQAVYAGLTYGKNQLNESVNDTLNNRGYTV